MTPSPSGARSSESNHQIAALHAQLNALEETLLDMMKAEGTRYFWSVRPELQTHFERLLTQCQAALPNHSLLASMEAKPSGGGERHQLGDILAKVRSLKAALPLPSAVLTPWMADLKATARTLLRIGKLPFWPFIFLNRTVRIDERQPVWRALIIVVEALVSVVLVYLIAWLRLRGGAP